MLSENIINPLGLRLGNLIIVPNLNPIEKEMWDKVQELTYNRVFTFIHTRSIGKGLTYSDVKPILLSGSILSICGFEFNDDGEWEHEKHPITLKRDRGNGYTIKECKLWGVAFLHELQNYHFGFTGEELTVSTTF